MSKSKLDPNEVDAPGDVPGFTATPSSKTASGGHSAGWAAGWTIFGGILGGIAGFIVTGFNPLGAYAGFGLGTSIAGNLTGATIGEEQVKAEAELVKEQTAAQVSLLQTQQAASLETFLSGQGTEGTVSTPATPDIPATATTPAIPGTPAVAGTATGQTAIEEARLGQERLSAKTQQTHAAQQILQARAGATSQGSKLVSEAASRGIKVGAGANESVAAAVQGGAEYVSDEAPLKQLAVYERTARQQIGNQSQELASVTQQANASIGAEGDAFTENQRQALASFKLQQEQTLGRAQLGQTQEATKVDIQAANASNNLWLNAFANIVEKGNSLLEDYWTPSTQKKKAVTKAFSPIYTDIGGLDAG